MKLPRFSLRRWTTQRLRWPARTSRPSVASLWAQLRKLIQAHGRLVARLLIGAIGSYLIAEAVGLAQSFWSVVTALVVIQSSVGGTVTAGIDRVIGTVVGALVGALVGLLHPLGMPEVLQLLIALTPLAFVTAVRPAYRIAPVTSIIVILAGADFHPFWLGAAYRVIEISLGTVVGVVVSLIVLPSHAHQAIRRHCARAIGPLTQLLEVYLMERGNFRIDRVYVLGDAVRSAIAAAEKTAVEARREPGARGMEAGIEIRALRRLHSDIIFIGRATHDWPEEAHWPELDAAIEQLEHVMHRALDSLSQAMLHGGSTGAVQDIEAAIAALVTALEQAPATMTTQKLAVVPFTLQTLRRDISDFAALLDPERQAHINAM